MLILKCCLLTYHLEVLFQRHFLHTPMVYIHVSWTIVSKPCEIVFRNWIYIFLPISDYLDQTCLLRTFKTQIVQSAFDHKHYFELGISLFWRTVGIQIYKSIWKFTIFIFLHVEERSIYNKRQSGNVLHLLYDSFTFVFHSIHACHIFTT